MPYQVELEMRRRTGVDRTGGTGELLRVL